MENNFFFMRFYKEINDDFDTYSPTSTEDEKIQIVNKAMSLFSSSVFPKKNKLAILDDDISDPIETFKSKHDNNLFMCRTLLKDIKIPHSPPNHYKIFNETSTTLYENYSRTLEYLTGKFYINDVIACRNEINNFNNGHVLCWSNTSILLDHILQTNYQKLDIDILTFGSPILVPSYKTITNCTNLYHEDDWMLGFVSALYKLDISDIPRDKLVEIELDNNQVCKMVIISKNKFQNDFTLPHRYYYAFF